MIKARRDGFSQQRLRSLALTAFAVMHSSLLPPPRAQIQYLGQKKEKKRVAKPSEKMKFVFDWCARLHRSIMPCSTPPLLLVLPRLSPPRPRACAQSPASLGCCGDLALPGPSVASNLRIAQ